jgi:hypothetical protein
MELPNLKELEKLLKMCRKQGITELEMRDMKFRFGDLPRESEETEETVKPGPTEEELLFWSTQPDPLAERAAQ